MERLVERLGFGTSAGDQKGNTPQGRKEYGCVLDGEVLKVKRIETERKVPRKNILLWNLKDRGKEPAGS